MVRTITPRLVKQSEYSNNVLSYCVHYSLSLSLSCFAPWMVMVLLHLRGGVGQAMYVLFMDAGTDFCINYTSFTSILIIACILFCKTDSLYIAIHVISMGTGRAVPLKVASRSKA